MKKPALLVRLLGALLLLVGLLPAARGQVTIAPAYFTDTTPITITFDATQGSGGLATYPGDVYLYTGVVTNISTSDSDRCRLTTGWTFIKPAWLRATS